MEMLDATRQDAPVSHPAPERAARPRPARAGSLLSFENMVPGGVLTSDRQRVDRQELVAFARIWDPMPFHVDEAAGGAAFGGLTAPGTYMLAMKQRLVHTLPPLDVIASLGFDEVRFHQPLRPGDEVAVRLEWVSRRVSQSRPDRGVVRIRYRLVNQFGSDVMTHFDNVLVRVKTTAATTCAPRFLGNDTRLNL
jgi:acyl dehydratase